MLKAGRWLARENPTLADPTAWTHELCAAYVAAVDRLHIGDYAQRRDPIRDRLGIPLSPRSKASVRSRPTKVSVLLAAARRNFPREYPLFLCAVRTGLRLGELLALQWPDVDFNGRFIEVRRNLVAGRVTTPKNSRTRRVDMSAQLTATLKDLLHARRNETLTRAGLA